MKWSLIALAAVFLNLVVAPSESNAQCYVKGAGGCEENGPKGRDSTCRYRCNISVRNGQRVMIIHKPRGDVVQRLRADQSK